MTCLNHWSLGDQSASVGTRRVSESVRRGTLNATRAMAAVHAVDHRVRLRLCVHRPSCGNPPFFSFSSVPILTGTCALAPAGAADRAQHPGRRQRRCRWLGHMHFRRPAATRGPGLGGAWGAWDDRGHRGRESAIVLTNRRVHFLVNACPPQMSLSGLLSAARTAGVVAYAVEDLRVLLDDGVVLTLLRTSVPDATLDTCPCV